MLIFSVCACHPERRGLSFAPCASYWWTRIAACGICATHHLLGPLLLSKLLLYSFTQMIWKNSQLELKWLKRDRNQLADDLTNEKFDMFDSSFRIPLERGRTGMEDTGQVPPTLR